MRPHLKGLQITSNCQAIISGPSTQGLAYLIGAVKVFPRKTSPDSNLITQEREIKMFLNVSKSSWHYRMLTENKKSEFFYRKVGPNYVSTCEYIWAVITSALFQLWMFFCYTVAGGLLIGLVGWIIYTIFWPPLAFIIHTMGWMEVDQSYVAAGEVLLYLYAAYAILCLMIKICSSLYRKFKDSNKQELSEPEETQVKKSFLSIVWQSKVEKICQPVRFTP